MTAVIIQCRLGSTRLPSKALLPLGSKTCIEWTLDAMKKVPADYYYLATDQKSYDQLLPIAQKRKWNCFAGSESNVLDRFTSLISRIEEINGKKITWVVRATGDNPFLFYEAAQRLLEEVKKTAEEGALPDYASYSGLPHGSGVEILNAQSLLKARSITDDPYDTEHVGPALYNHKDIWNCTFIQPPPQWHYPQMRTTIDTPSDYRRALRLVHAVYIRKEQSADGDKPFSADEILSALKEPWIIRPIFCVPQTKKGFGTGHARRMIDLAAKLKADIILPDDSSTAVKALVKEALEKKKLYPFQILDNTDSFQKQKSYALVIADYFKLNKELVEQLSSLGPLVSIDDSIKNDRGIQYLIEIIPPLHKKRCNLQDIMLLDLPEVSGQASKAKSGIMRILVCLGGEDPSNLAYNAALGCAQALHQNSIPFTLDVISSHPEEMKASLKSEKILFASSLKFVKPFPDLSHKLSGYDVVISHYGLTAFEACSLGIPLILLGTTRLHRALAKKYGFYHIKAVHLTAKTFASALKKPHLLKTTHPVFLPLYERLVTGREERSLEQAAASLCKGHEQDCPLCGEKNGFDPVVCRTKNKTIRRCRTCSMLYPSWITEGALHYDKTYFFEEYKKQYGKTYLEDFEQIKALGAERLSHIKTLLRTSDGKRILDVGCAYGPFLQASKEESFFPFGTDISSDAAEYVSSALKIPACTAVYPNIDTEKEFSIKKFDAVTMWFVIEHFKNLHEVLIKTGEILNDGGVFAFSTPSASGVSRVFSPKKFFTQSPLDHYTLWELRKCRHILRNYGFKVKKIVCTGHHSERFPFIQKKEKNTNGILFRFASIISRVFSLGDTFEVYCIKMPNKL